MANRDTQQPTLHGRLIDLVPYAATDHEALMAVRNQPEAIYGLAQGGPLSLDSQRRWYEGYLSRDNDFQWLMHSRRDKRVVGGIALYDIDLEAGTAECGRLVVDGSTAPAGPTALEASLLSLSFAFDVLKLSSIVATVREDRPKVLSYNERIGFKHPQPMLLRGVAYLKLTLARDDFQRKTLDDLVGVWSRRHEIG